MSIIPKEVIAAVEPGSIGPVELADDAVITDKLADDAVTTAKIAAGAVTATEILDETITLPKLAARLQLMTQATHAKAPCRVVATSNVTVAGGAPNTVDGVSLQMGDRVLCTAQTDPKENGIRVVTVLGTGSNGTWGWAADADTAGDIRAGTTTIIGEGTHALERWVQTGAGILTPGTNNQTWTLLASQVAGGEGIALGTGFAPDKIPSTTTLIAPSCEFAADQTQGTFTNAWDLSGLGRVTGSGVEAGGFWMGGTANFSHLAGFYSNTFPVGDFAMMWKMNAECSATSSGGALILMQGTGSTDDALWMGIYSTGYQSSLRNTYVVPLTAYNVYGADIHFQGNYGPAYFAVRYDATNFRTQVWVGNDPRSMALVSVNRSLGFTPTKIGFTLRGVSGSTKYFKPIFEWLRIRADTYDSTTTAKAPIDLAGALTV